MENMSGAVAVEGMSGSGKSTIVRALLEACQARGKRARVVSIESSHALLLRSIAEKFSVDDPSRMLLFWTIRLIQSKQIEEQIDTNDLLLVERLMGSTRANDQFGNGVPKQVIDWVGSHVRQPEKTLFLDVPLEVALQRKPSSRTLQDPEMAKRIYNGYQTQAQVFSWTRIDATQSVELVLQDSLTAIGL
jgi:thymidylate kinase